MASKALTCAASPLVSNKASFSSSSMALGPHSLVPRGPKSSKTPNSRLSLVVRAQEQGLEGEMPKEIARIDPLPPKEIARIDPLPPLMNLHNPKRAALLGSHPYMRTPWNTTEEEDVIRMWFDVPGLGATDIDVDVTDSLLTIRGLEGLDAYGRKTLSPLDWKIQLPLYCANYETKAELKNGVLYITVPKITKEEHMKRVHVPVKAI